MSPVGLYLRAWLRGEIFTDDSPDRRIVNGIGTAAAGVAPAPVSYRATKTDPFNNADYGSLQIAAAPSLQFGDGDFEISSYVRVNGSANNAILFQRGFSNGGFLSELTWFTYSFGPYWAVSATQLQTGVITMLADFGLVNNPPDFCFFVFDTAPLPDATERLYKLKRQGRRLFMECDGVVHLPNALLGAERFPVGYTLDGGSPAAEDIQLITRIAEAYTFETFLREYKIYTAAPGPGAAPQENWWNPNDKSPNITLSSANRLASIGFGPSGSVRAGVHRSTNESRYFEILLQGADVQSMPGIGLSLATLNQFPGIDGNGIGFFGDGNIYTGGVAIPYSGPYAGSVKIGVGLDGSDLIFFVNGASRGVAMTLPPQSFFPMWGAGTGGTGTREGVIATTAAEIEFLPPGFAPWVD